MHRSVCLGVRECLDPLLCASSAAGFHAFERCIVRWLSSNAAICIPCFAFMRFCACSDSMPGECCHSVLQLEPAGPVVYQVDSWLCSRALQMRQRLVSLCSERPLWYAAGRGELRQR
jgi:hypothetical protein